MTKIRNTKKGMAKKTLSISLAVAMLATSNVPVWAAEDLFTDGAAAVETVEAPVEDVFSDAAEEVVEEAPVVEEAVDTPEAYTWDNNTNPVNTKGYTETELEMSAVGRWGHEVDDITLQGDLVTVSGSIKDTQSNEVKNLKYIWLADNLPAAGKNEGTSTNGLADITYRPVHADFNKQLSVVIYEEDTVHANGVVYRTVINGGKVQAWDISEYVNKVNGVGESIYPYFDSTYDSFENQTWASDKVHNDRYTLPYNAEEQKPTVVNNNYELNVFVISNTPDEEKKLTLNDYDWHYETEGNDFENVTGKPIAVYGTLKDTYKRSSAAYGYTATTNKTLYKIRKVTPRLVNYSLVNTSFAYTGAEPEFGKKDVKVEIPVGDKNVDVTDALLDTAEFKGTEKNVGTGYSVNFVGSTCDFDYEHPLMNNFNIVWGNNTSNITKAAFTNKYDITKLDLAKCTATANREYTLTELGTTGFKPELSDITLTVDGKSFTLDQINDDVYVAVNEGIDTSKVGAIKDAFTIHYRTNVNTSNVIGEKTVDIMAVSMRFGNVYVLPSGKTAATATVNDWIELATNKNVVAANSTVGYNGKAYSLTGKSGALHTLTVNTLSNLENVPAEAYTVSYNNNVDAGIVEVTITGKETDSSYKGAVKKVYFKINPDAVAAGDFKATKDSVTINPANNHDASLYKDALGLKFETALDGSATGEKLALEYDKDYKVEYYYVTAADAAKTSLSVNDIKSSKGTNNVGDYVYAVATLVKDGNYALSTTSTQLIAKARISEKSISNVTITMEKDAYTFTGKEIAAKATVKDGSVTLVNGEDYILKYKNNIEVGTATLIVVPLQGSDYDVTTTAETTFEITPADAADVKVTLGNGKNTVPVDGKANTFRYCGKQIRPTVSEVKLNGVDVTKYFDITYPVYGENVNAGKEAGSVTIAPKANDKNFTGTKTQLFNIQGKELNGSMKLYNGDKTEVPMNWNWALRDDKVTKYGFYYDGTEQKFGEVKFIPEALADVTEGVDYEVKYFNNVDAGVGVVAIVGKGNYGNTTADINLNEGNTIYYTVTDGVLMSGTTEIAENIIAAAAFKVLPSYFTAKNIKVENGVYAGGKPVKPTVSVEVNGKTLVEGKDYTVKLTSIKGDATPDEFVDVTVDQPYSATITAKGGYKFDGIYGSSQFIWGIDKKDLAACDVTVTKNGEDFDLKVMNGNVTELKEEFDVVDNGDGTATVSVVDGGKNYTGSATVAIIDPDDKGAVGIVEIADVKVDGNKATVILTGEAENAEGYDYVISTVDDWKNGRVDITKNQLKTTGDFFYVQKGTYYAYCHAYRRDENGVKVFSPEFSKTFKFTVTAITPEKPAITSVTRKGNNVTVTYTTCKDAAGYDVVLGTANRVVNGERRPVDYGTLVKKNLKEGTTSVTFKNVPEGTYYAGLHAFNRSRQDNNNKVFSPWSDIKPITVK